MHIDIGVRDDCKNPESYGTICVKCNECGRFDDGTETWNGFHGQVAAPKGTFEKIYNDPDDDNDI